MREKGSNCGFAFSHATSVTKAITTPSRSSLHSATVGSDPSRDDCDVNSRRRGKLEHLLVQLSGSAFNHPTG
ncbi:unnamed protein product [Closterium sp. Yama58-4]|nr:unnamed protein product [Closterium sp. Yama58-4]